MDADVAASESALSGEISASRSRILDVSHDLFLAHGYRAVSMQQIAEAACIKKPTLYHHFRDKEDLFIAVMDTVMVRSRAAITDALDPAAPLREQLQTIATYVFAKTRSNFGRLMVDLHEQVSAESRAILFSSHSPPWELIRPAIRAAVASGEIRALDEDLASMLFFTTVWGHVWLARAGAHGETLDERYAARLVDLLMDGMSAYPSRVSPDDPDNCEHECVNKAPG